MLISWIMWGSTGHLHVFCTSPKGPSKSKISIQFWTKNQGAIGAMPGRLVSSHPTKVARSTCHTVHQCWEVLSAQCCSNLVLTPRLWLKTRYPSEFRNRWDMDISFPKNMAKNRGLDPSQSFFFLLTCISPRDP